MSREPGTAVELRPWGAGDLPLLERLMGDPEVTTHIGGAESREQIRKRHGRYVDLAGTGKGGMFAIVVGPAKEAVGAVGYWEFAWRETLVYETTWSVLPEFQGRGVATRAAAAVAALARAEGKHRFLHAFTSVGNAASNAICRRLGFSLVEECDIEYPKGSLRRHNVWRLDLLGG